MLVYQRVKLVHQSCAPNGPSWVTSNFQHVPPEKWWLLGLLRRRPAEGQGLAVQGAARLKTWDFVFLGPSQKYGNEIWNGKKYGNIWNHHLLHFFGNMELEWIGHNWTLDTLEKILPQPARVQQKSSNEPVRPQKREIGPGSVKQLRYYQRTDI